MKQIKQYLKNIKACIIAAFILCCAVSGAYAQTLMQPTGSDNYWYSSAGGAYPIIGLNSAMIAYDALSLKYLFASAYFDQSGTETISVIAPFAMSGSPYTLFPSSTIASVPDVIIGDYGTGGNQWVVAVAYVVNTPKVVVDFFEIHLTSGVLGSTGSLGTAYTSGTYVPHTVHLDAIADVRYAPNGLAYCDSFVVTWDDFTNATPDVYAALGRLSTHALTTEKKINPSGVSGYAPDVAAVLTNTVSPVPQADITYLDAGGTKLYLAFWDCNTTVTVSPVTLDDGTHSSTAIAKPRIDAYDDYNFNYLSSLVDYEVVAEVANSSSVLSEVRTYNNQTTVLPYFWSSTNGIVDISVIPAYSVTPGPGPYNEYAPTVAFGPFDYLVSHFMEYAASSDVLFMEPIKISSYNTLEGNKYYWVNSSTNPPTSVDAYSTYASAVSAPGNIQSNYSLYTWALFNGSSYRVYYKVNTGWPMSFRHMPTAVTNIQAATWQVYPNPAANMLIVKNATNAATDYSIMDVAGRTLLKGSLQCSNTNIDVSTLAAGTYVLKVYRQGADAGNELFVKN